MMAVNVIFSIYAILCITVSSVYLFTRLLEAMQDLSPDNTGFVLKIIHVCAIIQVILLGVGSIYLLVTSIFF